MLPSRATPTPARAISLLLAICGLAAASLAQSVESSPEPATRKWVVRDVLESVPSSIGTPLSMWMSYPLGDVGGEGQWDCVTFGIDTVSQGLTDLFAGFSSGRGGLSEVTLTKPVRFRFDWGDYVLPTVAPFRAGTRLETALLEQYSNEVYFLDNTSHQTVYRLPLPPPPSPGLPPMDWFRSIANVGDVDDDGFQDISFTGLAAHRFVAGLIDGATRQVLWQYYGDLEEYPTTILRIGPGELPDLDGDGIGDILTSYTVYKWSSVGPMENHYLALSGRDGSLIWTHVFQQRDWHRESILVPDVTGDGIPEIWGYSGVDPMALIDGANGQTIWEQPLAVAAQLLPDGRSGEVFEYPALFTASLDPAIPYELGIGGYYVMPVGNRHYPGIVHINPLDGTPLAWSGFTGDLQPWSPDTFDQRTTWLLGDVDGDGFVEVGHMVVDTALSALYSPFAVYHLAILGQQTLFGPDEVLPGQQLQLDAVIPAAPGQTLGLLASTVFAGDGGERLDGWPTNLGASPLYATSVQKLLHLATLGPTGRGRMSVVVPPNPALSGRPLYLRGVVTDAANPGKVLTLTSLHTVEVR